MGKEDGPSLFGLFRRRKAEAPRKSSSELSNQAKLVIGAAESLALSGHSVSAEVLVGQEDKRDVYLVLTPKEGAQSGETLKIHVQWDSLTQQDGVSYSVYSSSKSRFNPDTEERTANWKRVEEKGELPDLLKIALANAQPTNATVQTDGYRVLPLAVKA